jgi:putative ABC transport system ATP-binding protein
VTTPDLIAAAGLRRTFAAGDIRAVRGVDLTVRAGEFLALTGPSGSGKSTLLNLLGLLDTPTGGEYRLGGRRVDRLAERERTRVRARVTGFVFQGFHLIEHQTVLENVVTGLAYAGVARPDRRERAVAVLEQVGLGARRHARPGLLSGGERQRVAIARAVARRPDLLLCDEPTGNLDSANARGVLDILDRLHAGGQTLIVVTHDEYVAGRAPRRVHMRDGEISADRYQS